MSKTITIQIGNSDDKLTQKEWCRFCESIEAVSWKYNRAGSIHFHGCSHNRQEWQNAAWVIEFAGKHKSGGDPDADLEDLMKHLAQIRELYKQDSIAVTVGFTAFV